MENSQVKLTPQEIFNNKKLFSNTIYTRILKVIEEITKSFDNLRITNDKEKNFFLNTVNHYYNDICAVIFHLRQVVIKIDGNYQGVDDLQNVIIELNKIALIVQEFLNNSEIEKLKILLKDTIVDVGSQVETLMKIIKYDDLHEHKQKVLDCQHDLVISAEALKVFCQFFYLSLPESEKLVHEVIEKVKNNLIKIKTGHELLAEDFLHYTCHSVQKLQNYLNYMRKMVNTKNFHNDIASVLINVELCAINFINDLLEAVRYDNPMIKMLDVIENCHSNVRQAWVELQTGLQVATLKDIAKYDDHQTEQLIIYLFINGLNALSALNQSIEDAIMKK